VNYTKPLKEKSKLLLDQYNFYNQLINSL